MKDNEVFRAAELFVGTAAKLYPEKHWRMDVRSFALTVERLAKDGNVYAKLFQVYDGMTGKSCHDFHQLMTTAYTAGLVAFLAPEFKHFVVTIPGRLNDRFLSPSAEAELRDVEAVVTEYAASGP
jgi:hypothetical protein